MSADRVWCGEDAAPESTMRAPARGPFPWRSLALAALVFGALLTVVAIALIWTTVLRSDERAIVLDNFHIRFSRARQ